MRNLLNPKWIFIINTLPIIVLFFLFYREFNIINTLLKKDNIDLWKSFGITLASLGVLNFAYAVYLTLKKETVSPIYAAISLVCYIVFIYVYGFNSDRIIPFNIPQWMVSGNTVLYVGTFLMPTLAYSLFVLVTHFTPETKEHKAWKNFLIAIAIPVSWYLFSQILLPLWKPVDANFNIHAMIIFIIVGTLIFLFFLARGVLILATKKADVWKKYQLAWKVPISVILPLIGLAVNNRESFSGFSNGSSGIFGDFNNPWFYVLAVLNGILICLPAFDNKKYRFLLFIGRSITFAYTFYFFLVFLPFLPLSVVAIIAIGTGFLMLTPLMLFVIHVSELSKDFQFLKTHFTKAFLWSVSLFSFLIIPIIITTTYLRDRSVLNETLSYLYTPDYSKDYKINKSSLKKTLDVVKHHKDRGNDVIFLNQIPYLSSYFNWLVLDNMTLSDAKFNTIEKVFFDSASFQLRQERIQSNRVKITNVNTNSTYDTAQDAWLSWIDLELTNKSDDAFSEYATTIDLPEGCFISDYYLYVGNRKEMGILAEKKSAMWVFSQIRNENRDPGILYYLTGNKVAFRVFPFASREVRKTGIQLLHKEPLKIIIDSNAVRLGDDEVIANTETNLAGNVSYISAKQKLSLKEVQRKPYYHFIVDVSKDKEKYSKEFIDRIDQLKENNKELFDGAQISFVNSYVSSYTLDDKWREVYKAQTHEGGFFLDRGIKKTLFNAFRHSSNSYPIMVTVTDDLQSSILEKDFSDYQMAFPESDVFFNLKANGVLEPHSLTSNPLRSLTDSTYFIAAKPVLEYSADDGSIFYLPTDSSASVVLRKEKLKAFNADIRERNWTSALAMQGMWLNQIFHPEISDKEWLNLVKYSFISKVMTPVTSYLVVENEAQKAILKRKQEQVLSSNKSLDLGDDSERMSEPSFILMAILLGAALWYKEKRRRTRLL